MLVGVALLSAFLADRALQQRTLQRDNDAARVVTLAGKQRMLSQKIALHATALSDPTLTPGERAHQQEALSEAIATMAVDLEALLDGDPVRGVDPLDPALDPLYFGPDGEVARQSRGYLHQARSLEQSASEGLVDLERTRALQREAEALLPQLDRAVTRHEALADAPIASLQAQNAISVLLAIGALGGLWVGAVLPTVRALREEHAERERIGKRLETEASENAFLAQVNQALDLVDTESGLLGVFQRALQEFALDRSALLLLADASNAHLKTAVSRQALSAPGDAPRCQVGCPRDCAAVRRGRPVVFPNSQALDACPHLAGGEPTSAACLPVNFMGRSLGVLHTRGPVGTAPAPEDLHRMEALVSATASRLGSVRAFEQMQLQASTDPLTGLLNRRALEEKVRKLVLANTPFSVGIADLDHFKRLNDTLGHEMGDHALVTYSNVLREGMRSEDLVARFGGEEFVVVCPGIAAEAGKELLEGIRRRLAEVVAGADTPTFTASYGVSDTRCGSNLDVLVRTADVALLRAKETGRDRILIADMGGGEVVPMPILRPDERVG